MKKIFVLSLLFLSCEKEDLTTKKTIVENKVINHSTVSFNVTGINNPQCYINGKLVDRLQGYDVKTGDSIRITSIGSCYTLTADMSYHCPEQTSSILINGVTKSQKSCSCSVMNNKYNVN